MAALYISSDSDGRSGSVDGKEQDHIVQSEQ